MSALAALTGSLFSQNGIPERQKKPALARDRFYLGGGFGFSLGSSSHVELAPVLGYRITDTWHAGLGISYFYSSNAFQDLNTGTVYRYEQSIYGGSLFTRYFLFENLFLHGEYEMLNVQIPQVTNAGIIYDRQFVPSLLLGAGYYQKMGNKSVFYLTLLYDVWQHPYSVYASTGYLVYRLGFGFGL